VHYPLAEWHGKQGAALGGSVGLGSLLTLRKQ
jgi:hypothetical protein